LTEAVSNVLSALMIIVGPTTVIAGQSSGVTMSWTMRNSFAPSILAASRTSVLIALRLAEMMTMQKPVMVQMPTKIRAALLVVELTSHATGCCPNDPSNALSVPVWGVPGGW